MGGKEKGERRKECALQGQKNSARGNTLGKGERRKVKMPAGGKRLKSTRWNEILDTSLLDELIGWNRVAATCDVGAVFRE